MIFSDFFYRNGSSGSAICAFTVETIKARFADKVFTSKDAVLTPLAVSKIPDGFVPGKVSMCTWNRIFNEHAVLITCDIIHDYR